MEWSSTDERVLLWSPIAPDCTVETECLDTAGWPAVERPWDPMTGFGTPVGVDFTFVLAAAAVVEVVFVSFGDSSPL